MINIQNCYYDYEKQLISQNAVTVDNTQVIPCSTADFFDESMVSKLGSEYVYNENSYPVVNCFPVSVQLPSVRLNYAHHVITSSAVVLNVIFDVEGTNTNYTYKWFKGPIFGENYSGNIDVSSLNFTQLQNETNNSLNLLATNDSIGYYYCEVTNNNGSVYTNVIAVANIQGNGSSDNPYIIDTKERLFALKLLDVSNGGNLENSSIYCLQNADLDLSGRNAYPIKLGSLILHYNGNGYQITNSTVLDGGSNNLALFEELLTGSEVINLGFVNCTSSGGTAASNLGILAAKYSACYIDNVYAKNCSIVINGSYKNKQVVVGGILGYAEESVNRNNIKIYNCYSDTNISFRTDQAVFDNKQLYIAGIGGTGGTFVNCYYSGTLITGIFNSEFVNPIGNDFKTAQSNITNCYYDSVKYIFDSGNTILPSTISNVTAKTTTEMQSEDFIQEIGKSYYYVS